MDRIDPCLHIVKASILEDTFPLIRWMGYGDLAAVAEAEEEEEIDDGQTDTGRGGAALSRQVQFISPHNFSERERIRGDDMLHFFFLMALQ